MPLTDRGVRTRTEVSSHFAARRWDRRSIEVVVEGRGNAFPEQSITTTEAISLVVERGVSERAAQRIASAARAEDIVTRKIAAPIDWYRRAHTLEERLALCDSAGMVLACRAAAEAMLAANCRPEEVGAVVFVSSTMLSMPSPDGRLVQELGLPGSVMRVPVWGRGCAGGAAGLGLANRLAAASNDAVLLVVVETCTAHGHADDVRMLSLLIALLYGDGATAMVLRRRRPGSSTPATATAPKRARILGSDSVLVADTSALGGWDIDGEGLHYRHLPEISEVSAREVPKAVRAAADRLGVGHLIGSGHLWAALHPTSAAVMEAQATALGLHPDALRLNLEVFARIGNTSAPSVLVALDEILQHAPTNTAVLALATGPGYSIEQVWFQT
jgi:alkylresorcinol/alkylpyrone synthase